MILIGDYKWIKFMIILNKGCIYSIKCIIHRKILKIYGEFKDYNWIGLSISWIIEMIIGFCEVMGDLRYVNL